MCKHRSFIDFLIREHNFLLAKVQMLRLSPETKRRGPRRESVAAVAAVRFLDARHRPKTRLLRRKPVGGPECEVLLEISY